MKVRQSRTARFSKNAHNAIRAGLMLASMSMIFLTPFSVRAEDAASSSHTIPEALLYVTNSASAIRSLQYHVSSMDTIAPQTYATTPGGKLLGVPNARILKIAHDAGAKIMPIVVNQGFLQQSVHDFLVSNAAQSRLLVSLVAEANDKGYIGYQYDFEHMFVTDRDLYTAFVQKSAQVFHTAGLEFSVAMGPQHSADPSKYGAGSWNNWTGAFDYQAIGAAADFVSVMAYDDSQSLGPVASMPWVEEVIDYTLARIPAEKVSLGVPFYAWVWNNKTGTREAIRSYPAVAQLLASGSYTKAGWSDELGVPFVQYRKSGKSLTVWYEDQRSFQEKLALVSNNKLRGFSAWALGQEDPNIWGKLAALRAPETGLAFNK